MCKHILVVHEGRKPYACPICDCNTLEDILKKFMMEKRQSNPSIGNCILLAYALYKLPNDLKMMKNKSPYM